MKRKLMTLAIALFLVFGFVALNTYKGAIFGGSDHRYAPMMAAQSFHSLSAVTLEGASFDFSQLAGKRVLVVNTASRCGYTPQYKKLQELYDQYGGEDFTILGFPCNQFGRQEPGSASEIGEFCTKNYGVTFQMMEKVDVKGDNQHPVYSWLCNASENGVGDHKVAWNFHKFLVDGEGRLVASLKSGADPLGEEIAGFASGR